MRIRQRQFLYGTVFGFSMFLVGWFITYIFTPDDFLTDFSRWKVTLWVFLSAHFVSISGYQLGGLGAAFTQVDIISELPALRSLRVVPILLTALGGVMMVEVVGYSTRFKHLIQNSSALLIGYVGAGILAIITSDARPAVAISIFLAAVLASAAYIGAMVTQRLTANIPVFAVTSLGGVILIGLIVMFGGLVIFQPIAPLVGVSLIGVSIGATLAWIARNAPS